MAGEGLWREGAVVHKPARKSRNLIALAAGLATVGACLQVAGGTAQPVRGTSEVRHARVLTVASSSAQVATPIKHVVFIVQENHSFDNLLGKVCKVRVTPCNGVTTGKLGTKTVNLSQASDIVANTGHTAFDEPKAVDGGLMDRFDLIRNCAVPYAWRCYSQYSASQIPNVAKMANTFGVSDRTFSQGLFASSMQHFELLSGGITDGFVPDFIQTSTGPGWGCDSGNKALWQANASSPGTWQPFCVPAPAGSAAALAEPPDVQTSPVKWIPTILDRLGAAGRCVEDLCRSRQDKPRLRLGNVSVLRRVLVNGPQHTHLVPTRSILTDAANGTLPNFSLLLPSGGVTGETAQHNFDSMKVGDNWLGQVVTALEKSPQWLSTAIFLTYDDCGCFYDHVAPPAGFGIRVPMIVISPYVKPHYTDSNQASFTSVIAFTERIFGIAPLGYADNFSYAYMQMFNWSQTPLRPATMVTSSIPAASLNFVATHKADPDDPT